MSIAFGADAGGERVVGERVDVAPQRGLRRQALRHRVGPAHAGIAVDDRGVAVMRREQRLEEGRDRVGQEIGGDVANAQGPRGIALVRRGRQRGSGRMRARPGAMAFGEELGSLVVAVVEREQQAAVQPRAVVRRARGGIGERRFHAGDGAVDVALGLQHAAEIARDRDRVGAQRARVPQRRHRFAEAPGMAQRLAVHEMRHGQIRVERGRELGIGDRLVGAAVLPQGDRDVVERLAVVGLEAQRVRVGGDRARRDRRDRAAGCRG